MRKLFYLLPFVLMALSCNNDDVCKENEMLVLDIEKALETRECVNLSKYASAINYIPLETNLDCMMSGDESMQIVKHGENFYFYSEGSSAPVFCFGRDGKFRRFIGTQGRANNEFRRYVRDFVINEESGDMLISDLEANLLFYDKNGNYKHTASLPSQSVTVGDDCRIVYKGNGEYFYIGYYKDENLYQSVSEPIIKNSDDFVIHINSSGDELLRRYLGPTYSHVEFKKNGRYGLSLDPTALYNSDGLVNIRRRDTIYRYDCEQDTLMVEYLLDFGKLQEKGGKPKARLLPKRTGVFINSEKFVLFLMLFGKQYFPDLENTFLVFLYDKESRKIKSLEEDPEYGFALEFCGFGTMPGEKKGYAGFINDLDGGAPFMPRYIKDGRMYQLMDAIRFMDLAEKSNSRAMKKVAASMNEDSNPVIIEVVLK